MAAPCAARPLQVPPTFNSWVLTEDMLLFHRRALQQQLEQTYVALGLAAAAGRAFVLPEVGRGGGAGAGVHGVQRTRSTELPLLQGAALSPQAAFLPPSPTSASACLCPLCPQFSCFCQNSEAPLPRCRRPDSHKVQFPVPCPEGEVLQPLERFADPAGAGAALRVLPHAALHSMEMEEASREPSLLGAELNANLQLPDLCSFPVEPAAGGRPLPGS